MKLYYSNTSPYSRKVRMLIHVKQLDNQIERILIDPFNHQNTLKILNPLGKIPVLMIDNNDTLFDSPVICHFLDSLSEKVVLIPSDTTLKWQVFRWEALADGLIDACYNIVMERRRPLAEQSVTSIANWSIEIHQVLTEIEKKVAELNGQIRLTQLAIGAALGYIDFRLSTLWYESSCLQVATYPKLITWYERFKTQDFMLATAPV